MVRKAMRVGEYSTQKYKSEDACLVFLRPDTTNRPRPQPSMKFLFALAASLSAFALAANGAVVTRAKPTGIHVDLPMKRDAFEVHADGTFSIPPGIHVLPGNVSRLPDIFLSDAAATVNNPFHIGVNVGQEVSISVQSKAAFFQFVTISGIPGIATTVFSGSGEGASMHASPTPPAPGSTTSLVITPQTDGYLLTLLFQFSTTGAGGTRQTAVINDLPVPVEEIPGTVLISVQSEDSTDNDNNDSDVSIFITTVSS